jgi:hypothetical protein
MRIMCLNGWGGPLHDPLIAYLRDACPDVLCLQEVVHTPATDKAGLVYRDGDHVLPQRPSLFRDVAAAHFCPARACSGTASSRLPRNGGLATFVNGRFPIVAQQQGFVHKAFAPHGYGAHPRSRTAHAVRLYDLRRLQHRAVERCTLISDSTSAIC